MAAAIDVVRVGRTRGLGGTLARAKACHKARI